MNVVVDARGLACPLPVIRLAAAARDLPGGTRVTVLWTDPAAAHDIPAWARMRGHRVVPDHDAVADDAAASDDVIPLDDGAAPHEGRTTVLLQTHDGPAPAGAGPS